jgi:hypothetical protein
MKHRKSRDYNGINNLPTAAGFHPSTVAMENEPFSSMIYLFNCLVSIDAKHRLNHSHVRTPEIHKKWVNMHCQVAVGSSWGTNDLQNWLFYFFVFNHG